MQRLISRFSRLAVIGAATTALSLSLSAASPSGVVDFGQFTPPASGGTYVNVNMPRTLIQLASRFMEKDEPEISEVIAGLEAIHVHVLEMDDDNRAELAERAAKVRTDLGGKGWEHVVQVREDGQQVDVYVSMKEDDVIAGVAITVLDDGGEAVFVNVVGNVRPDQLVKLGQRLDIEPLRDLPEHIQHS